LISINLKKQEFEVLEAWDYDTAIASFSKNEDIAVAILDIMLGDGPDGFFIASQLRKLSDKIGIIILSAKSLEEDKMKGFASGVDDYITKPFSPKELVMRVEALCRRVIMTAKNRQKTIIKSGPFELDEVARTVKKDGKYLDLTGIEYQLLVLFMQNPSIAFTRESILDKVWGKDYAGEYKTVDVNIRRVRMKIEDDPAVPKYLQTVWGYGYKWEGSRTYNF